MLADLSGQACPPPFDRLALHSGCTPVGWKALPNEALQQMKPAFSSDCAGFTAERRC